eukprot:1141070-Rhodomonas_salina.2
MEKTQLADELTTHPLVWQDVPEAKQSILAKIRSTYSAMDPRLCCAQFNDDTRMGLESAVRCPI